jgi:hypothetical protein
VVCWFELESAALDDVGGVGFDVAYVPAGEGAVEDGRIVGELIGCMRLRPVTCRRRSTMARCSGMVLS